LAGWWQKNRGTSIFRGLSSQIPTSLDTRLVAEITLTTRANTMFKPTYQACIMTGVILEPQWEDYGGVKKFLF
jgi:hypothetical protein